MTEDQIIADVIEKEGGYVDHDADRGGPTNMGITIGTLSAWLGREATAADVRALTREQAVAIYRSRYVREPGFDRIEHPALRALVIDCGVLHGPGRAARWLQAAAGVAVDGRIGPRTLAAVNGGDALRLHARIVVARLRFIADIVARDTSQVVFLRGWVARATDFIA